jgi:hypothetical protein
MVSRPERVDCHSFTTRASLWPPARWPGSLGGQLLGLARFEARRWDDENVRPNGDVDWQGSPANEKRAEYYFL